MPIFNHPDAQWVEAIEIERWDTHHRLASLWNPPLIKTVYGATGYQIVAQTDEEIELAVRTAHEEAEIEATLPKPTGAGWFMPLAAFMSDGLRLEKSGEKTRAIKIITGSYLLRRNGHPWTFIPAEQVPQTNV